jgi:hypothetical protein
MAFGQKETHRGLRYAMYEAPWKDCFTKCPKLARGMQISKENDVDFKDRVNKAVAYALDKSGLGQGLPPLHPATDSTQGSTSQSFEQWLHVI